MNNSASVLFKFLNESDDLAIGFKEFIENPLSDEELSKIVKEERVISVKWPTCKIGPDAKMNDRLKKSPEFQFRLARVIAFGGKCFLF